jgi:hypothetical protein
LKSVDAIVDPEVWDEMDREVVVEAKSCLEEDRPHHKGLPLGFSKQDLVPNETGGLRGRRLPPPIDADVNSGFYKSDFFIGQKVLVWYWGLWWHAKVIGIPKTKDCLTIRYNWSGKPFYGIPSRLIHPFP